MTTKTKAEEFFNELLLFLGAAVIVAAIVAVLYLLISTMVIARDAEKKADAINRCVPEAYTAALYRLCMTGALNDQK